MSLIDEFQIISIEHKNKNYLKSVDEIAKEKSKKESPFLLNNNEKKISNIKEPQKEKSIINTTWNTITSSFLSVKDYIIYNDSINILSTPIDLNKEKYIKILDKSFFPIINISNIKKYLKLMIQMTYRTNFFPIQNSKTKEEYNKDSGWGCMVRSGQMMLSKAILDYKLFSNNNLINIYNSINTEDEFYLMIKDEEINKKKFETLLLFLDNPISMDDVKGKSDFINYLKINNNIDNNDIKIIPPFSILNIFILGREILNKEPGEWFSDNNLVQIFCSIQTKYKILNNYEFLSFLNGYISKNTIIKKCFKQIENCDICDKSNIGCIDGKYYKFEKAGLIFVTVRLGLRNIESNYLNNFVKLFNIRNNLGIIGGKTNKAFYFIGINPEKKELLYLDPHVNNVAVKNVEELRINTNFDTYKIKNIYSLKLSNLSPCFTIGFNFKNFEEFNILMKDLSNFSNECGQYSFINSGT